MIRNLIHKRKESKQVLEMSAKEAKALDNPVLLQSIRQKLAISMNGITKLYTPLFIELLYWMLCCRWPEINELKGHYKQGTAKLEKHLDLLRIIKRLSHLRVMEKAFTNPERRKLRKQLAK